MSSHGMSRRLEDLADFFQPKVAAFLAASQAAGYPLRLTRTLTDQTTQAALYAVGRRPLTGQETDRLRQEGLFPASQAAPVTNAPDARSTPHGPLWEGKALAFDCIPLTPTGAAWWGAPDQVWRVLYRLAERHGLDALGDPWGEYLSFDKGHFAEPGWKIYQALP